MQIPDPFFSCLGQFPSIDHYIYTWEPANVSMDFIQDWTAPQGNILCQRVNQSHLNKQQNLAL